MTSIRKGCRYRARADVTVTVMTAWRAPYTGGESATLPAGEEVIVENDPPAGATAVYCLPAWQDELEARLVSAEDRSHRKYAGYYLCIRLEQLDSEFESIPPAC